MYHINLNSRACLEVNYLSIVIFAETVSLENDIFRVTPHNYKKVIATLKSIAPKKLNFKIVLYQLQLEGVRGLGFS